MHWFLNSDFFFNCVRVHSKLHSRVFVFVWYTSINYKQEKLQMCTCNVKWHTWYICISISVLVNIHIMVFLCSVCYEYGIYVVSSTHTQNVLNWCPGPLGQNNACMYICMCVYVCMFMYVYVCMYVCMYECMYDRIWILNLDIW